MFGVDKRQNTWTREFDTLLQDLAGHYPAYLGGIGGVEYPQVDLVVHLAAHAKVHQLVRQPHRALENAIMTFNVLEYCRGLESAARLLVDARGLRRRAPVRGVRRGDRRLRLHGEPVLGVEDHLARRSSTRTPLLRPATTSSSASRTCTGATTTICSGWSACCPLFIAQLSRGEPITVFGGDDKVLDFTYIDDCVEGIARGVEAARRRAGHE